LHEAEVTSSLRSRQWLSALAHLKPLLEAEPRRAQLWFWRGLANGGMGKWKEAMPDIEQGLASDRTLADDLNAGNRYKGARCAVLAAGARRNATAEERSRLRKQALAWLRADLVVWPLQWSGAVRQTLERWQKDPDLAGIRDAAALAKLPAEEQADCKKLWADVAALLEKAKP
jgi:hypothetical protein